MQISNVDLSRGIFHIDIGASLVALADDIIRYCAHAVTTCSWHD
jgi:hypothetical protein